MIYIRLIFIAFHRAGNCRNNLVESSNKLMFIFAAGHHNYIHSLSHFLREINNLKNTALYVYQYFLIGQHVERRTANGVPSDTVLGQTYNSK